MSDDKATASELHAQIQYKLIEKLSASELRFRTLVDSLDDLLFTLDESGNIEFVNRAFTEVLGYRKEDLKNTAFINYIHPNDRTSHALLPITAPTSHSGELTRHDCRLLNASGDAIWFSLSTRKSSDFRIDGLAIDITDRLEAEELRRNEAQRSKTIAHLNRYLPGNLIDEILAGQFSMDAPATARNITIMFTDLTSFTHKSQQLGAASVSKLLNDYLTAMNDIIFKHQGTIDKFIGDAIMVMFGAPKPMAAPEQVERATRCAIEMQNAMTMLSREWEDQGVSKLTMRIGIHHGEAIVGNFGSDKRSDYTSIGPEVNKASRIEGVCSKGDILISSEVEKLLPSTIQTECVGEHTLKGIDDVAMLFRVIGAH